MGLRASVRYTKAKRLLTNEDVDTNIKVLKRPVVLEVLNRRRNGGIASRALMNVNAVSHFQMVLRNWSKGFLVDIDVFLRGSSMGGRQRSTGQMNSLEEGMCGSNSALESIL